MQGNLWLVNLLFFKVWVLVEINYHITLIDIFRPTKRKMRIWISLANTSRTLLIVWDLNPCRLKVKFRLDFSYIFFQDDICGINEYIYLSEHNYVNSESKQGLSKVVLALSNWSWVQDIKERSEKNFRCDPSDFSISFKISSTDFKNPEKTNDSHLYFDKQGALLKYSDFFLLLKNSQFLDFISTVKQKFENPPDDSKLSPDEIYSIYFGTGTQPENLDEVNRNYARAMKANGYQVPSCYTTSTPVTTDLDSDSDQTITTPGPSPLISGKRKSLQKKSAQSKKKSKKL